MFRVAMGFWGFTQVALDRFPTDQLPDAFDYAAGVNLAFSLEVYLKCLGMLDGKSIVGIHDLEDLYMQLEPATKEKAEQIYDEVRKNDSRCLRDAEAVRRAGEDPEDYFSLAAALKKSANAFKRLRYVYEETEVSDFTLNPLIIAIHRIILERKPEWNPARFYSRNSPE
jgi:hypothetical protein